MVIHGYSWLLIIMKMDGMIIPRTMMKTNPLGTVVDLHLQVVEPCDSSAVWQVCLIMPKKDGISCVAEKKNIKQSDMELTCS